MEGSTIMTEIKPLQIDPEGHKRKECFNCKSFASCGKGKGFSCLIKSKMVKPSDTCKKFESRHHEKTKIVYLNVMMEIVALPEDATEADYGNEVLENIKASNYTLADMGHGVYVEDPEDLMWRAKKCQ
jgi:hypothetical protein